MANRVDQSRIVLEAARSLVEGNPLLVPLLVGQTEDELRFEFDDGRRTVLKAFPCTARGIRGYACSTMVLDEFAHFLDSDGSSAAEQVWAAITPAVAQFGSARDGGRVDAAGVTDKPLQGSGTETSETRQVAPFDAIEVSGLADAVVTVGQARKVTVRGDDNLLEHVETEVSGDELEISQDEDLDPKVGIGVDIRTPELDMITLSGAGDLTARGIDGEVLRAEVSGAGGVGATGRVDSVEIVISGAGDVRFRRLVAQEASVEVSGAGSVHVTATDSLTASVSGVGDVVYSGHPESVDKDVSGLGEVRPR